MYERLEAINLRVGNEINSVLNDCGYAYKGMLNIMFSYYFSGFGNKNVSKQG